MHVLAVTPDGGDIPLARPFKGCGQLRSNKLANFTVIGFPMKIRGSHIGLFYPEVGGQKIWEIRELRLLCWSHRLGSRLSRFFANQCFEFIRAEVVDHPLAFQELPQIEVSRNIDDLERSQLALGSSKT